MAIKFCKKPPQIKHFKDLEVLAAFKINNNGDSVYLKIPELIKAQMDCHRKINAMCVGKSSGASGPKYCTVEECAEVIPVESEIQIYE